MTNLYEQTISAIRAAVAAAVQKAFPDCDLPEITIMEPREKEHGDFSTNAAMLMAKQAKMPPRAIAERILESLDISATFISRCEIAGAGFINFYMNAEWLYPLPGIIESAGDNYGRVNVGRGKRVNVEFVSANPTGPMHMGNARGGALGDCLAAVLDWAGYDVTREFYINDAGNQMEKFGRSLEARYVQLLKGEDAIEFPEDGYQGGDIREMMEEYIAEQGDKLLECDQDERRRVLSAYGLSKNMETNKRVLETYGIHYDVWFSERSLYESGQLDDTLKLLKQSGVAYESDGALWFAATRFGSEKDEVLVRQNGIPTYFGADIAYHINKFKARKFDIAIDVWGADHHGHVARMKGALAAAGLDPDAFHVALVQLVRLMRDGEVARMSKRTGKTISLSDLLDETGTDAARFMFNMRQAGSQMDFDLDLAVEQSNDNPVFYVQYAHARICSIIRILGESNVNIRPFGDINPELLCAPEELELLKRLAELPEEIKGAALSFEPSRITRYVMDVAALFHSFYSSCRVKTDDAELTAARLKLADSTRIVIRNVLNMLGITAPEKM